MALPFMMNSGRCSVEYADRAYCCWVLAGFDRGSLLYSVANGVVQLRRIEEVLTAVIQRMYVFVFVLGIRATFRFVQLEWVVRIRSFVRCSKMGQPCDLFFKLSGTVRLRLTQNDDRTSV